jgi:polyisoprenoid-binding protein YceI
MSTTALTLAAGTWAADTVHSMVTFKVRHFGIAWVQGGFGDFTTQLTITESGDMQLTGSSPVSAISFTNEQLVGHLMSPDFFDAQLHPTISFTSSDIELSADGSARVAGDLTMRGVTKPIELTGTWSGPLEDLYGAQRLGLELAGDIDRYDFGISWAANLPSGADVVGRTVRLEGAFELVQQ